MKNLKIIFNKILALILPNRCLSCNQFISEEEIFCHQHKSKIKLHTIHQCNICAEKIIDKNQKICQNCQNSRPLFSSVTAIFTFNDYIGKVIHDLKYYDKTYLKNRLAKLLANSINKCAKNYDVITGVPLHKKKLKQRKFNQTIILCNEIVKYHRNLQLKSNLIQRIKFSKSQTWLSQEERQKNIKNSFIVNKNQINNIKNKKIILVDDVMTTGATIQNCAKILIENGAKEVKILVLAKSVIS